MGVSHFAATNLYCDNQSAIQIAHNDADANAKKEKANKKNSGAPKRPSSAFFVFMDEFRKSFKENFPDNKSVSVVGKAGGVKWKEMSESEKAPYVAKAMKKKAEYEKAMEEFNSKLNGNGELKPDESGKSSSEVHDENDLLRTDEC
ncbi:hypothetical protein CsSME_00027053 [Camellia sinensis var. sinensis]